jgi:light-regulated signal transduction histidine kinase (bacteriophytochrome)
MLRELSDLTRRQEELFWQQSTASAREIAAHERAEAVLRTAQVELAQRAAELEVANQELEAFSYSVSHDLRAPLRTIDGFSLALLEDYGDVIDPAGQDYLRRVRAAAQRMAELIDDLLLLARVTRSEMHRTTVDLSVLARNIAGGLQVSEPERQVTLRIAEGVSAEGDMRLLRVVLENLLGNAWKFTSKHATACIEFGVTTAHGVPAYFVRDDGAGFDQAYSSKLFGAFQRLHGMTEFSGTGIGLATVARIVQRHGGHVWAEGALEKGATFYFTL